MSYIIPIRATSGDVIVMKTAQKRVDYENPESVVLELAMESKILEGSPGGTETPGGGTGY